MKKILIPGAAIFGSFVLVSCQQPPSCDLSEADLADLANTHAAATGPVHADPANIDWETFVSAHYFDDAVFLPPNGPAVEGHAAMVALFSSWPKLTKFHTVDVETLGSGDMAFVRGTYELTMHVNDSTDVNDKGKYMEVWQKRDGRWRCARDIFNSDLHAAP